MHFSPGFTNKAYLNINGYIQSMRISICGLCFWQSLGHLHLFQRHSWVLDRSAGSPSRVYTTEKELGQTTHCHGNMSSCYHCFVGFRGRLWKRVWLILSYELRQIYMSFLRNIWQQFWSIKWIFVFLFLLCSFIGMHLNAWPSYRRDWGHKNSSLETRKQHQLCVIA